MTSASLNDTPGAIPAFFVYIPPPRNVPPTGISPRHPICFNARGFRVVEPTGSSASLRSRPSPSRHLAREAPMRRLSAPAFAALVLCAAYGRSQAPTGKDATRLAEVRFTDGSIVRMIVLQESLEVVTKYGKLTIPANDIRKI